VALVGDCRTVLGQFVNGMAERTPHESVSAWLDTLRQHADARQPAGRLLNLAD